MKIESLSSTGLSNEKVSQQITKCLCISAPGPHAFILVCRFGRFTEEEIKTVDYLNKTFGENMKDYLIVLFTGKDLIDDSGSNFEQLLLEVPENMKIILSKCKNRAIAFDNNAKQSSQVNDLFNMIDNMVNKNGGTFYTAPVFVEAEKDMLRRQEEIREIVDQKILEAKQKLEQDRENEKLRQQVAILEAQRIDEKHARERARREANESEDTLLAKICKGTWKFLWG